MPYHFINGALSSNIASAVYTDTDSFGTEQTTHSYTVDIGTPTGDRFVVMASSGTFRDSTPIPTVLFNGVAATQLYMFPTTTSGHTVMFYGATVPTGTTMTIAISEAADAVTVSALTIWAVYGLVSTTPTATGGSATDNAVVNLNIAAGGVAFGTVWSSNGSTSGFNWTNMTERSDGDTLVVDRGRYSGADASSATAQTLAVQSDGLGTVSNYRLALIAMR